MSFGSLTLTGEVLPTIYTSQKDASAYLQKENSFGDFSLDIIGQADREIDFGRYDNDGPDGLPNSGDDDGIVDCLFINIQTLPEGFFTSPEGGGDNLDFWSRDEAYRLTHRGNLGDETDPFDGTQFTVFAPTTNPGSGGATEETKGALIGPSVTGIRRRPDGVMLADITPPRWAG
jgi:hypothetical protein